MKTGHFKSPTTNKNILLPGGNMEYAMHVPCDPDFKGPYPAQQWLFNTNHQDS